MSKYPTRHGKKWTEEEVMYLISSINDRRSIQDIAKDHERTENGIFCQIKKMAVEYHFIHNLSIDDIQLITGLTKEEIENAIKDHIEIKNNKKKKEMDKSNSKLLKE